MVKTPVAVQTDALYIERDTDRKIRHRNKLYYRFNHWPIWIFVFFIAPGPLTFDLFDRGFDMRLAMWLVFVLACTAIAGLRGRLPGCEPRPYIIRFTEDRPNPLYRRICYTTAWGEVVAFAVEARVRTHRYHQVEVTATSVEAGTSFAGDADARARVDTRRDLDLETARFAAIAFRY